MSSKRAVKNARRKARVAKRVSPSPSRMDSPPESPEISELEALLLSRGWAVFDRVTGRAMYDWPPSVDKATGEVTSLIVDELDAHDAGRYRVRCVDGDRRTFDDDESLIADLEEIEAARA
jgi:hypothetical protein